MGRGSRTLIEGSPEERFNFVSLSGQLGFSSHTDVVGVRSEVIGSPRLQVDISGDNLGLSINHDTSSYGDGTQYRSVERRTATLPLVNGRQHDIPQASPSIRPRPLNDDLYTAEIWTTTQIGFLHPPLPPDTGTTMDTRTSYLELGYDVGEDTTTSAELTSPNSPTRTTTHNYSITSSPASMNNNVTGSKLKRSASRGTVKSIRRSFGKIFRKIRENDNKYNPEFV